MFRNALLLPGLFLVAQAFPKLPPSHVATLVRPDETQQVANDDEKLIQPISTELKEHPVSDTTLDIQIGDMILTQEQYNILTGDNIDEARGLSQTKVDNWSYEVDGQPGMVGVPVRVSGRFNSEQKKQIKLAMKEIEDWTCIRFLNDDEKRYTNRIYVRKSDECSSKVGMRGGEQDLKLKSRCLKLREDERQSTAYGSIVHEFMHALGFAHEHYRHDRLNYINISAGCEDENIMIKYDRYNEAFDTLDTEYDYCSVMHYGERYGDCKITPRVPIACKVRGQTINHLGQRIGLSEVDKLEINRRYCKGCDADEFRCGDGKCITKYWKCDEIQDCDDNSDESDCGSNCGADQFECGNGECIRKDWECDGLVDCTDSSDENNC